MCHACRLARQDGLELEINMPQELQPGRNDPCPCGSGKKYKKCHGAALSGGPDEIGVTANKPISPKLPGGFAVELDTESE